VPLALKGHDKACRSRACRSTLALGDHSGGTGWPPSKRKPRAMVLIQGKKAAKENDGEKNCVRAAARFTSTAALRKPGGSVNTPSDEKESTSKPANLMPSPAATP